MNETKLSYSKFWFHVRANHANCSKITEDNQEVNETKWFLVNIYKYMYKMTVGKGSSFQRDFPLCSYKLISISWQFSCLLLSAKGIGMSH